MNRQLATIAATYLGVLLSAAAVFDFAEGKDFWSSAWWAVVTASTEGYGDLSPTTIVGRIVAIVLMHLTTLLVMPLLTADSGQADREQRRRHPRRARRNQADVASPEARVGVLAGALGEAARTPPAPGSASEDR